MVAPLYFMDKTSDCKISKWKNDMFEWLFKNIFYFTHPLSII